MTQRDSEWDDTERGWMLALAEVEADTCPGCKQPLSESTDPATEGKWAVPPPHRCQSCTALAIHGKAYQDAKHPQALFLGTERID